MEVLMSSRKVQLQVNKQTLYCMDWYNSRDIKIVRWGNERRIRNLASLLSRAQEPDLVTQ